ncbi:MAG: acetyl-CoA C-acyltransferase [Fibrobacteria bacterium]|nr:acetyl-CoA C-acyltransferase [Fibrobacteria bacterium]
MKNPVIVAAVRTPVGKAKRGTLVNYRPDDLAGLVFKAALERTPNLPKEAVDDIVLGCAMPEGEAGMNMANIAKFVGGLPHSVSAYTINRFCSSGLQSIALASDSIAVGRNDVVIAGGTESMSLIPMTGNKLAPNPDLVDNSPEVYFSMGITAERVAEKYKVRREDQDAFAVESHQRAAKAITEKKFESEIVPVEFDYTSIGKDGKKRTDKISFTTDEGPRADTTLEVLAGLKTAFKINGTVTAGNASQMSDGAGCVIVMSEDKAKALKIKPIARLVGYSVAGVPPELMGIGPVEAIPKVLKQVNLELKDIGLIELNEAFASQAIAVINTLKLDPAIVNVNGGAIALGHPLGATGAILTTKLINEMKRRKVKYGMVSMCIGGGMGAAGIIENLD